MITELQKRFEADAYKQKMNYAGSAGIAAEQGFLAGVDFLQHLLQQTPCTTLLPKVQQMIKDLEVESKSYPKMWTNDVIRLLNKVQELAAIA